MSILEARDDYERKQAFYYQAAIDLADAQLLGTLTDEQLLALREEYALRRLQFMRSVDRLMEFL